MMIPGKIGVESLVNIMPTGLLSVVNMTDFLICIPISQRLTHAVLAKVVFIFLIELLRLDTLLENILYCMLN